MTYANHIALNVGVAISALWWAAIPPQWHHTPEQCADLAHGSALSWFAWGLGLREKPAQPVKET